MTPKWKQERRSRVRKGYSPKQTPDPKMNQDMLFGFMDEADKDENKWHSRYQQKNKRRD
jgi:hypothetical protein